MTFFVFLLLGLGLLSSCGQNVDSDTVNPIQDASVFLQGNKLYAKVQLRPETLRRLVTDLVHGEPILAYYRLQFYRHQEHLPDLRLANVVIKRRLRLRLIIQRYEMWEINRKRTQYTADQEEAMRFLGSPRYILLGQNVQLPPENQYYLKIQLHMEHQGMSWVLGVLNRWLSMNRSDIHEFTTEFEMP